MKSLLSLCIGVSCCIALFGCEESVPESEVDALVEQPDVSMMVPDQGLVADLGANCVLVRDEAGEWVPECAEPDQLIVADIGAGPRLAVSIATPEQGTVFNEGASVFVSGSVVATEVELAFVAVELSVAGAIDTAVQFNRETGLFAAEVSILPPGEHVLTFTARAAPDLEVSESVTIVVECGFSTDFDEPLDPQMWKVLGSASLHPDGWLEMSNNQTSTSGGIFLTGRTINPGSLQLSFRISTGASQCPVPDMSCARPDGRPYEISDGFAVTFWNVAPEGVDELWSALCRCGSGAVTTRTILESQGRLEPPEGITIEFDSYPNSCPNNGFFDPVQMPHIEILQNGRFHRAPDGLTREERCMLTDFSEEEGETWAAYPDFTDNLWHDVDLSIEGGRVTVHIDGGLVLDADLPDFRFKGGVLAFSGGSGAVPAFQRFDDLSIESGCP